MQSSTACAVFNVIYPYLIFIPFCLFHSYDTTFSPPLAFAFLTNPNTFSVMNLLSNMIQLDYSICPQPAGKSGAVGSLPVLFCFQSDLSVTDWVLITSLLEQIGPSPVYTVNSWWLSIALYHYFFWMGYCHWILLPQQFLRIFSHYNQQGHSPMRRSLRGYVFLCCGYTGIYFTAVEIPRRTHQEFDRRKPRSRLCD